MLATVAPLLSYLFLKLCDECAEAASLIRFAESSVGTALRPEAGAVRRRPPMRCDVDLLVPVAEHEPERIDLERERQGDQVVYVDRPVPALDPLDDDAGEGAADLVQAGGEPGTGEPGESPELGNLIGGAKAGGSWRVAFGHDGQSRAVLTNRQPAGMIGADLRRSEGGSQVESLLTPDELATYLQVKPTTLRDWRYKGDGPVFIRLAGHVRYRRADVDRWLEDSAVDHAAL